MVSPTSNEGDSYELTDTEWADLKAICPFVAQVLGDQPTEHDLAIIRQHIPACPDCRIKYAQFYLDQTGEGDE